MNKKYLEILNEKIKKCEDTILRFKSDPAKELFSDKELFFKGVHYGLELARSIFNKMETDDETV